jgi:hypothetical protein
MKTQKLVYLILISFLSGCASGYRITYNTEPRGASIICDGINEGYSPVTLNYSPDENNKKYGSMNTVPCTAIWSSGARESFSNTWDLKEFPDGVMQTLQRPNTEGYSQDAGFALQLRQTEAAEDAAAAARDSADEARRQNNKTTTCYTNYGGSVTCY